MATTTTSPTPDEFLRAARFYQDKIRLALVPIEPGEKRPADGLAGWQRRPLDSELIEEHVRAGAGLGAVHAHSGTATLDLDATRELAALALGAVGVDMEALLEAPGPKTIGNPENPPKPWYRVPDGYDLSRRPLNWPKREGPTARKVVLELRAGAVQDVLPPTIHPGTGEPYRWTTPPRTREDFPLIPGPLLGLWLAWEQLRPAMEAACPWGEPATPAATPQPFRPNGRPHHDGPSIIDEWNGRVPAAVVLERNGYRPAGSGRWLAPDSTSGDPGVVELDGRIFSHHGSDLLAGPHSHDSFGVLTVLEHGGDAKEAARSAALELGVDRRDTFRPPSRSRERAARARAVLTGTAS